MKKQSTSRSAFFNPRVLIGFVLCSIAVLLTLAALSKSADSNSHRNGDGANTGTWTLTGSLNTGRRFHTATLLLNGMALVAGGVDSSFLPSASAELYDPASETWSITGSLNTAREDHTATLLPNGMVLVAGGEDSSFYAFSQARNCTIR